MGEMGCLGGEIKYLGRLAGERAPRLVDDRPGDDQRELGVVGVLVEELVDREERRLGVERVEDGLHHEDVAAAVAEAVHLLLVRGHHLVPRAVAEARVFD